MLGVCQGRTLSVNLPANIGASKLKCMTMKRHFNHVFSNNNLLISFLFFHVVSNL